MGIKQSVECSRVNMLTYRREIDWIDISSIRQRRNNGLYRRVIIFSLVLHVNDWHSPSIDG